MKVLLIAMLIAPSVFGVGVTFVGDIMLDELPGRVIERGNDPFAFVAGELSPARLRVGNLESLVATKGTAVRKPFTFRAHPRTLKTLSKYFDGVTIANNHSGDFGRDAFAEMLGLLRAFPIPFFGGGDNLREAHAPWVVKRDGVTFAFLGYNEFKPRSFEAGPSMPGIAWSDDEQVLHDIANARKIPGVDLVIPFMHWGWEEETSPCERQRALARKMIDAGAALVVGAHPHVTQGLETYKGKLIAYSLGNFLFNSFETLDTTTGWMLHTEFDRGGLQSYRIQVVTLDADGVPHLK
jgi:poly-gamma-glutamate capsule biosynthesis protein CapA/YwtB (metallophosphatase superfamily)